MTTITAPADTTTSPRRPPGARLWIDFFLIAFMLINMAWAMNAARWSPGLDRLLPVVLIGIVAGTLVALSGFRGGFSHFYIFLVGAAAILWSMSALAPAELVGQERVFNILRRTADWAYFAYADQPVADSMVFVLLLSILVWILAYSAIWSYFRERRKWQAIIPVGLAMLVNLYYAPPNLNAYFVIFLLCAILLLVRATLAHKEEEWQRSKVHFPFDISFDFMRDGILFALLVIFASWVLPSAAGDGQFNALLEPLERPWSQLQNEWDRLFSTINYGRGGAAPSFGTSLALGGPRNVTDEIIMDIETPIDRYYRAVVMDTYVQGGWVLQDAAGVRLDDQFDLQLPEWDDRLPITQTITLYQAGNVLVSAPQPIQVHLDADARVLPDSVEDFSTDSDEPQAAEIAMIVSRRPLSAGDSYEVTGSITTASEFQLRNDHRAYPEHIRDRYLPLPETVPARVIELAEELATDLDNPYDIARGIESYLRTFPYDDQIPGPAPGQDGVDYFLFEEMAGYCNYYASSMAVMLRSLGIPARMAVGYATGEYLPQTELYRIRNDDSHTWVEVYFPTYGWVEFEPTASEPVIFRPSGNEEEDGGGSLFSGSGDDANDLSEENSNIPIDEEQMADSGGLTPFTPSSWMEHNAGMIMLLASLLGILAVLVWSFRRFQRPRKPKKAAFASIPPGYTTRLWDKVMRWIQRLDLGRQASYTPLEQASVLTNNIPEASSGITVIADVYVRDLYSPHPITSEEASDAQYSWLLLRPILFRHWLVKRLHIPEGLKRSLFLRSADDSGKED